jgi:TolB-like protein/tetratricopeptide (TPR) repeat protein
MKLIDELKRRNVFRVGAAYVLLGWVVVQVTDTVSPALNLPEWTLSFVTWIGIIGFPIALFFAWAYELTPDGIKREGDVDPAESISQATGRKLDMVLIALLAITIGLIAWDTYSRTPDDGARAGGAPADTGATDDTQPSADSVAVLPLVNMSAATDNAFFAGGVHEEILTNLSRIDGLRVVSRTTVLRYTNSGLSVKDIGRELDARYIVEGSVRRIADHVRITVQLIDAVNDAHLWARNYDRELVDVFAIQSEVARQITNSLHLEIMPETVGALDDMPTRSVKAYDMFLKAKSIERSEYQSEFTLQRQRELLEAAVEEDPNFVEAWGYLNDVLDETARTIIQNYWFGETQAERQKNLAEVKAAGKRALDRAVALDPDNIETLMALGSDFVAEQGDAGYRVGRKTYIDRAIELEPDNAFAWYVLAWWHRLEGDIERATSAFLKALELDPFHARIITGSLVHFRSTGDQEMTTRLFERLAQIAPETGEDTSLAEIPVYVRLNNLMTQFLATADESIVEEYADEFAKGIGRFEPPLTETLSRVRLLQFQHDMEGILDVSIDALPEVPQWEEFFAYVVGNDLVMAAQSRAGRFDDAEATALRIVEGHRKFTRLLDDGASSQVLRFTAAALAILDDEDMMRELLDALVDEEGNLLDSYPVLNYVALSRFDLDRSVELILAQKSRHPSWYGTDMIAAFYLWSRDLVTHPDMHRFYVEEGKWVDYLAAEVPEYAQYRQ